MPPTDTENPYIVGFNDMISMLTLYRSIPESERVAWTMDPDGPFHALVTNHERLAWCFTALVEFASRMLTDEEIQEFAITLTALREGLNESD
jgi:hypothetical protein